MPIAPPIIEPQPIDTTKPSGRFAQWIDSLAISWSGRLGLWAGAFIAKGFEGFADIMGKSYSKKLTSVLQIATKSDALPSELKPIFDEMLAPTGEAAAFGLDKVANSVVGGAMSSLVGAILLPFTRWVQKQNLNTRIGGDLVLQAALRQIPMTPNFHERLFEEGFSDAEQSILFALKQVIFPSDIVSEIWLRDKEKYGALWTDVKMLGVNDDQIAILKELA